jgi:hypothetical protein
MSNIKYQCPRCKQNFPKKYNLDKHLKRINPCRYIKELEFEFKTEDKSDEIQRLSRKLPLDDLDNIGYESGTQFDDDEIDQNVSCSYCKVKIRHKKNLRRHYDICRQYHDNNLSNGNLLVEINKLKTEFQQQIDELKHQPRVVEQHNQNILQVLCIGNNDNYLDMLTEQLGFDRALGFLKDCALSQLTGDCKLLEKIYFNGRTGEFPIRCLDKNRNKIEFIDEKRRRIIDIKGVQLSRRLANNLQNSYLKGVNHLINRTLDDNQCPNKFLEEYDLQSWNQHIYDLSDIRYQRKIITQLDIPYQ